MSLHSPLHLDTPEGGKTLLLACDGFLHMQIGYDNLSSADFIVKKINKYMGYTSF